jgi:hypothetical protein
MPEPEPDDARPIPREEREAWPAAVKDEFFELVWGEQSAPEKMTAGNARAYIRRYAREYEDRLNG